jgi:hypothetical protein
MAKFEELDELSNPDLSGLGTIRRWPDRKNSGIQGLRGKTGSRITNSKLSKTKIKEMPLKRGISFCLISSFCHTGGGRYPIFIN